MNTTLFFAAFLFLSFSSYSQWVQQNSNTANPLNGVHCTAPDTCFAAGNTGTARKTVDGGVNWTISTTSSFTNLTFIKMYDANKIWAGKANGTFHYSSNAGATWTQVSAGNPAQTMYDVFFHDANNFIAVGGSPTNHTTGGQIIATTNNGGTSWTPVNNSGVPTMFGIHCFSSSVCVACAGAETIYKTTDGGANWTVKNSGTTKTLYDIHFPVSSIGYAVGGDPADPSSGAVAIKSTDGGETWSALTLPFPNTLYGVHFVNADSGFAVGNGGTLLVTVNGGVNWFVQPSPVATDLNKVYFANDTVGYIAGAAGVILKTTNGGGFTTAVNENNSPGVPAVLNNPASHWLILETGAELKDAELEVYSSLGQQKEIRKNISGSRIEVSVSSFPPGIYFFKLFAGEKFFFGKFMTSH